MSFLFERGDRLFEVEAHLVDGGDNPALFVEIESINEVFEGDEGRESDCSDIELTSEEHDALWEWLYDGLQDDFEYWRQMEG